LDGIGLSPAQIVMAHRLKTPLPINAELLKLEETQDIKHHLRKIKERKRFYYDKLCNKELASLYRDDKVSPKHDKKWIQATHAQVIHCSDA